MAGPIPFYLLPDNAAADATGELTIAGLRCTDLAAEFGTPVFIYDEAHLEARCEEAVAAFGPGVSYASKSFMCKAMARIAHRAGMRIDVATGGEMAVALAAGVPARRLVFHGNNKSSEELREAIWLGVGCIVVDSFDEMDRIDALVAKGLSAPTVMIRVTPGVEAHTHEFVQTGQEDSKFGFGWKSGAAEEAIARARASASMEFHGLHMHIGSQVFSVENFAEALHTVAPLAQQFQPDEFCVGGGLGVPYVEGEEGPSLSQWGAVVRRTCAEAGITAEVTAEPGRSIAASAGLTLYTVGTIKEITGIRTYVSVDGGMSDNPRPVLYGSGYETFLPSQVAADRPDTVRVVGKHCESGDLLVREGSVPAGLAVGDILCTPVTGAYGHSMGSNYNKVLRPPVVFVKNGRARQVIRRETIDDLLGLEA